MYVCGKKTNRLLRHVRNIIIMYVNFYFEVLLLTLFIFLLNFDQHRWTFGVVILIVLSIQLWIVYTKAKEANSPSASGILVSAPCGRVRIYQSNAGCDMREGLNRWRERAREKESAVFLEQECSMARGCASRVRASSVTAIVCCAWADLDAHHHRHRLRVPHRVGAGRGGPCGL